MKKTILYTLLAIASLSASQMYAQSPLQVGVKGGLNFADLTGGYSSKLKYQFGVTLDYELSPNFYAMSGLVFNAQGAKSKKVVVDPELGNQKLAISPNFLQIPMHLGFKIGLGNDTRLMFHTGPFIAIGLGGKSKLSYRDADNHKVTREQGYFGKGKASRMDFGLGLGFAVQHDRMTIGLGYDTGLVGKRQMDGSKEKHKNLELTFGYRIF